MRGFNKIDERQLLQVAMSQIHNNRVIDDEEVKTLESEYDQEVNEDDELSQTD